MTSGVMTRVLGKLSMKWGDLFQNGTASSGVFHNAGAPTDGTSGTLAKLAPPGALLIDTTNKTFFQNTNTQASPTWTALTTATGAGTYTGTFNGITGGTTPAAGTFTTLTASGASSLAAVTSSGLVTAATATTTGLLTAESLKVSTGTKTATASSGAATLAKGSGIITSETLSTAAGAVYTLTLTNSVITATSWVLASTWLGTSTQGIPVIQSVAPASTSCVIKVLNADAADAFNGTIKIGFLVIIA
jgi:hypothetical protein